MAAEDTIADVRLGAGRPPKPKDLPEGDQLLAELLQAEADRASATASFRRAPSIANKCALLESELRCAQACGARCRREGNYTHALKFGDLVCKLAAQHATAKDQMMADDLDRLEGKIERERLAARDG